MSAKPVFFNLDLGWLLPCLGCAPDLHKVNGMDKYLEGKIGVYDKGEA
jgi:hypothetical protein